MTKVHILSPGFTTPNGIGFLFPILFHHKALRSAGINCRVFDEIGPELTDSDVVIVDSKFYMRSWGDGPDTVLEQLGVLKEGVARLLWFDTSDGTGTLQSAVLARVDGYYKNQMLRDRSIYKRPLYGMRLHTDFYHRNYGIIDEKPMISEPLDDEGLAKMDVSWNCGMADRSHLAPGLAKLFNRVGWRFLLRQPNRWTQPGADREIEVSSHFNVSHTRATVRYHREMAREILGGEARTKRIGRRAYLREMEGTKVVVAPFSYGEITFRDFEASIAGCLLVKPDMDHMTTWPDIYQKDVTYVGYDWKMEGLTELLEQVAANYSDYIEIARAGQAEYRRAVVGDEARDGFVERFARIVQGG